MILERLKLQRRALRSLYDLPHQILYEADATFSSVCYLDEATGVEDRYGADTDGGTTRRRKESHFR
jgi:hypothetical protein